MAQALGEVARVLRPDGQLYVSKPVYAGPFNEVVRLIKDECGVRAAAQAALNQALQPGEWDQVADVRFDTPMLFRDFAVVERRIMRATFADHRIDDAMFATVRAAFDAHCGADGARFVRAMHVRLLRRRGDVAKA